MCNVALMEGIVKSTLLSVIVKSTAFQDRCFVDTVLGIKLKTDFLRQICVAHQVAIAFTRSAASFIDGPDNQALTAPHVTGRKDTF
jgi:hypothetical protein